MCTYQEKAMWGHREKATRTHWLFDEIWSHKMNEFAQGIVVDSGKMKPQVCIPGCSPDQRSVRQGEKGKTMEGEQTVRWKESSREWWLEESSGRSRDWRTLSSVLIAQVRYGQELTNPWKPDLDKSIVSGVWAAGAETWLEWVEEIMGITNIK